MLLFIALYIINYGISLVQGQILQESTIFISGNVIFTWTSSNDSDYDVLVYRDRTFSSKWIRVYDTQYTVKDVMLNYFIELFVDMRAIVSSEYNIMTYNVSKVKAQIGGSAIMTWTASSFPSTGQYHVYHTYKENRTILSIRSSGVSYEGNTQTSKYTYTSRPFNSTNIEFEIRDITLEDAGYYNGGMSAEAAWSSGGTVLIVSAKPQKPEIKGNLTTRVDTYLELTCISKSTSTPDYYSKLVTLSYTWFINNTEIKGEVEKTLKLNVTIEHTCNRYSCIATEEGLDSDRSDTVRTDLLYFDDQVIYVNDEWVSDRIAVDIQEKNPLQIFCYAEGGPTPTVRLGKSQNGGTVILSEARDHWSNYSFGTGAQCSDTGTYVCSGQSTDLNTNTKAIDVNILCEPRLDKQVEMKTITESVKTRIVIIPIVAHPSPVLSKLVWLGPDDIPTNITTSAVLQRNGVIYKHRIISIISGLEDEIFGEYKLLYEGKVLTNVFIRREEYEMSRGHKVVIVVLSTILGITWLMIITYVIFKKQLLLLHKIDKRKDESHQLQTQSMAQHYDDLQDTDVDKNYTALDRTDQESPYEETL